MMKSSNGNIFRVTGSLWGESTRHRWIPLTKASDAELSCFLWSTLEQTVEQALETLVIWHAIALIMTSLIFIHPCNIHTVIAVLYKISCYIEPRLSGTWQSIFQCHNSRCSVSFYKTNWKQILVMSVLGCPMGNMPVSIHKNTERHIAHTIVSWPNPKQWAIVHTSDLMMMIRQSIYILSIITREMGKLKTHSSTYFIMDNCKIMPYLTHTLDKIHLTGIL